MQFGHHSQGMVSISAVQEPDLQQMLFWVAMVSSVSPSCVNATPSKLISSTVRLHASAFAIAVMDAVSSQEFIV